jgi:membrane protein required for colicin V production
VNIIDSILLLLLCLFGLRGYFKGLFREAFSLLGLVVGFAAGLRYDSWVAEFISTYQQFPPFLNKPVSFIVAFFSVYLAFGITGWLLHRFAQFLLLHGVDRVGGLLIGAGKGLAILGLSLFFLNAFPLLPQPVVSKIKESYLAGPLAHAAGGVLRIGKEIKILPDTNSKEVADRINSV